MSLTGTVSPEGTVMVMNQHRHDRYRTDRALVDAAITHVRGLLQRSVSSGWTGHVTADGTRQVLGHAGSPWEEVLAEACGESSAAVHQYLLTMQPRLALTLLALLEDLGRDLSTGAASAAVRGHTLEMAEQLLTYQEPPPAREGSQSGKAETTDER